MDDPFWKTTPLSKMTADQWESLCDGCAQCCLHAVEDEETGEVERIGVACRLLDLETCRCTDYARRFALVPGCIKVNGDVIRNTSWLPDTCAYRLVAAGEDLKWWHPLVSGSSESVHEAGISVRGRAISERDVAPEELEDLLD